MQRQLRMKKFLCRRGATGQRHCDQRWSRVLCVTALMSSVAQQKAAQLAERIHWNGRFYRRDIGWRAIKQAN